jgi:hypothetical protein
MQASISKIWGWEHKRNMFHPMLWIELFWNSVFLEGPWSCGFQTVEQIKGWTRASVIALILIACTELDHCDPATADKLKPLHKVLDKCWALPCHVFWLHNNGMNIFDLIICDIFFRVFILC